MAAPSELELEAQVAAATDLPNTLLLAQTVQTELDALTALVEADNAERILDGAAGFVAAFDAVFGSAYAVILESWVAYNRHLAGGVATDAGCFPEIYRYLNDNTGSVESRVFVNGAVVAGGGNTGTGTIRRVLVDGQGYAIQNRHAQLVSARCVLDGNTGTVRHGARFEFKGPPQNPLGGFLPFKSASTQGNGAVQLMDAHHASTQGNLIVNGSFDAVTVAAGQPTTGADAALASGDSIDNWTANTVTNLGSSVDNVYREEPGVTASKLLIVETNVLLTQEWEALGISAVPGTAYWAQIALQRKSTADGTFTCRVGALTFSVDVTTLTNDVWTLLVPTANENLYGENLTETGATNEIQLASNTTGDVWADSFMACPMETFDAIPYAPVSGATEFLLSTEDRFTFTDTLSAEGILGLWLFLLFGVMLPHNATPTIPDP